MIQLVYISAALGLWTDLQITEILNTSQRNNSRDRITGVLLYKSGSVIQVLEGAEADVRRLFELIQADSRHHQVRLIYERPIQVREFGNWAMGFRVIDTGFESMPSGAEEIRDLIAKIALEPHSRPGMLLRTFDGAIR